MKVLFLTFALCLITFSSFAAVTLRGTITYQNTGSKMKAVQITARGASPTITRGTTNTEGSFVLTFPDGKVGDLVTLELGTPIYDVVNAPHELTVTLTDNNAYKVRLVVCKKGERDANAVTYYNISTQYLESNYQKQIKRKDWDIANLNNQLALNGSNVDELTKRLYAAKAERANLDDQLEKQKKNALKIAEDFSRIDLVQADAVFQKAFETFKKGDIDGARAVLNSKEVQQQAADLTKLESDIEKSDAQVKKVEESLNAAKSKIADAKLQRDALKTSVIKKKMLDGQLAELQNKFDEAERIYTEGVDLDSTNVNNVKALAFFLQNQNKTNKAIRYYEKALSLTKSEELIGGLSNNLSTVYMTANKMSEAEKYGAESSDIFERLSKVNPQLYEFKLAETFLNRGVFYQKNNKILEAEKYYLKVLEIGERLSNSHSEQIEFNLAKTVMNLGVLNQFNNKMPEAEKYYLRAFDIYERLSKNSKKFESELALTAMNLGNLNNLINKMSKAEKFHLLALEIYERLSKINPQKFEPKLSITAMNLSVYYYANGKLAESEKYNLMSIKINERLSKINAQQFEPDLARSTMNLGNTYLAWNKLLDAEKYYLKSLEIYERLSKSNPQQFEPDLALTILNLGAFYYTSNKMTEAEKYCLKSVEIYEHLSKTNAQQFEPYLAQSAFNLADFYTKLNNLKAAEKYYLQSYEIFKKFHKLSPAQFEPYLVAFYISYSKLQVLDKRFKEAEESIRLGLVLDNSLVAALDPSLPSPNVNLAHTLLFQNKDAEAKKLYDGFKKLKNAQEKSYLDILKEDFEAFEKAGLDKTQIDKARKWLTE
jgi:tetratricopeptide (TPR) repeat protein